MSKDKSLVPTERIERSILMIRGQKVMLDRDLAYLYAVTTKVLNQAVKRHKDRFPEDFAFQLTMEEARIWWTEVRGGGLRSQIVTLKRGQHIKYRPYAFTEHGILMLSSVLNSERAVKVNIQIMRAFVRLRRMLASHDESARKLDALEKKYDAQFKIVFDAIRQLVAPPEPEPPKKRIGFLVEEPHVPYGGGQWGQIFILDFATITVIPKKLAHLKCTYSAECKAHSVNHLNLSHSVIGSI